MTQNLILFAAGGGNDIFSLLCYIKANSLDTKYKKLFIVGVLGLTPFHVENIGETVEKPLLKPKHRYILNKEFKKIICMESLIAEAMSALNVKCDYIFMSSKYSPKEQALNLLEKFENYPINVTKIRVVDFGGDILTDGKQNSIISPELDAFTLSVVDSLPYRSNLVVCFPGCDGELDEQYLTHMCETKSSSKKLQDIILWSSALGKVNQIVSQYRGGNTIPNMIAITDFLANKAKKLLLVLNKHWVVDGEKILWNRKIELNWLLQNYSYKFLLPLDNPYQFIFGEDLYTTHKNLLNVNPDITSNDFKYQYIRKDSHGLWTSKEIFDGQEIMRID